MIIDFCLAKIERHFLKIYDEAKQYEVELDSVIDTVDGRVWFCEFEGRKVKRLESTKE